MSEEKKDSKQSDAEFIAMLDSVSSQIAEKLGEIENVSARFYVMKIVKSKMNAVLSKKHDEAMKGLSGKSFSIPLGSPLADLLGAPQKIGQTQQSNNANPMDWVKDVVGDGDEE